MKKIIFIIALLFLSFLNAAESGYEKTQKVYLDACAECHGSDGKKLDLGLNSFENIIKENRLSSVLATLHSSVLQNDNQKLYSTETMEKLKNLKNTKIDEGYISYYIADEFKEFNFFEWLMYAVLVFIAIIGVSSQKKGKQSSSVIINNNNNNNNNKETVITKVTCTGTLLNIYINNKLNPTYMIGGCSEIKNWNSNSVTYRSLSNNGKLIITIGINGKETSRYIEN